MASTGEEISFSCKVYSAVYSSVFNYPSSFAWSIRSREDNGAAMQKEFGTNVWKTLHNLIKERGSVCAVGLLRSLVASAVWLATSSRPGRMT